MRTSFLLLLPLFCAAQTAQYPGSVVTDNQLMVAKNQLTTTLISPVSTTDTTIVVKSTTGFVPNMLVTIDNEILNVCGVSGSNNLSIGHSSCPNVDGRGFDSSTAAAHVINKVVSAFVDAWHHNAVTAEIKAIESAIGPQAGIYNVRSYGAKGDGVADDTAAINAAAAAAAAGSKHGQVTLPPGTYKVTDAIVLTGTMTITGPGAVITVPPAFNLSAIGVIVLKYAKDTDCAVTSGLCPGAANVSNLTIRFQNTDTTSYGALVNFPPGIACGDVYGCDFSTIENVKITQAMTAIRIKPQAGTSPGNQGAAVHFRHLAISAFDYGLYLDGSDSEMTLDDYSFYPFDMTNNHGQIWPVHGTGIWASALYDLNVTNYTASNFYRTLAANFTSTKPYCPNINIAGLVVDTYGGIDVNCGSVHISAASWPTADIVPQAYYFATVQNTGNLQITGSKFYHSRVAGGPAELFKITNSGGTLSVVNSVFVLQGTATLASSKLLFTGTGGRTMFSGNVIQATSAAYDFTGAPFVDVQAGGLLTFTANRFTPAGAGANGIGLFFDPTGDAAHNIAGNTFGGWGVSYPTTQTLGIYQTDGAQCPTLASLGTPPNGRATCCADCKNSVDNAVTVGAACVGSGAGATAVRINNAWRCY